MTSILVTGGTGTLGRPTVARLCAAGHDVRVFSRKPGGDRPPWPEVVTGDLTTGAGLAAAVDGVDVIVHLATSLGRRDVQHARNLLAAAPRTTHLVVMSIVGIDRIP
ncbi:MAG TPA: NAD(P)H-binding protein, partial [Kribbella sp.]|nr:NAD(P)H-binding protein [Kribbella sp.]